MRSFRNAGTADIANRRNTKAARILLPRELHEKAWLKLTRLNASPSLQSLQSLRGNRLEALRGDRDGQFSIRINDRYRICFEWVSNNAENLEIVDYH
ncbi:MAG: type II toxin-antitoxin system RelE/ParE family toxin [Planctomycetes bacterium]|nr:type II toxin-antitoxin system RelE/ParE family toxin [Planctomycetota bacterium]